MAVMTEPVHAGEFIYSQAAGNRSRDQGTLASGQAQVAAGTIVGKLTASGKYVALALSGSDGSQAAAGVLYQYTDATSADMRCVVVTRDSELNQSVLTYPAGATSTQIQTINAALAALGVIVRPAV